MDALRQSVDERLRVLQEDNAARLEQMRVTVDERLQGTLEARLGESFRVVSERLEQVHRGLGEMQALAAGVGDLKKVLTNVKTRGTWGEVQLGTLLEQVLAPAQYEANVATKAGSADRVEFAIKLPGRDPSDAGRVAADRREVPAGGLPAAARGVGPRRRGRRWRRPRRTSRRSSRRRRRTSATSTSTRRTRPTSASCSCRPRGSTRRCCGGPAWPTLVQRDMRVVLAGPTTLWAVLNSLQMGFRTLAIEKRSSEVWAVLGTVKTQFAKFGDIVSAVQKKLQEATNKMDAIARQSRTIERKLRVVQELPAGEPTRPEPARAGPARAGRGDDADAGRARAHAQSSAA